MIDIYIGYLILCGFSVLSFLASRSLTKAWNATQLNVAAIVSVILLLCYTCFVWESHLLAKILPFSNLIVLGNWFPIGAACLAGIVSTNFQEDKFRQAVSLAGLLLVGGLASIYPLLGSAPECNDHWGPKEICFQTTNKTCTAACSATLLNQYGISVSEQEMAELCFTRNGTSWKGLYRGLKLKTQDKSLDVVVDSLSLEELEAKKMPVILRVGIDRWSTTTVATGAEDGWTPGTVHSIIYLGTVNGRIYIADPNPNIGIEIWDQETLESLWDGHAVYLEGPEDSVPANLLGFK